MNNFQERVCRLLDAYGLSHASMSWDCEESHGDWRVRLLVAWDERWIKIVIEDTIEHEAKRWTLWELDRHLAKEARNGTVRSSKGSTGTAKEIRSN